MFRITYSVIFFALLFSGCGSDNSQATTNGAPAGEASASGKANAPQTYTTLTVTPRPVTLYLDFPATIQGQQDIDVRPKIDGYVQAIYVDEGATVTKGQPLFKINNPQYAEAVRTARAGVETALADANTARLAVNKVRPLVEKEIISEYDLESAQYTLQTKQAALLQARAALATANTNVGYTTLYSPVNGVVGAIPYRVGSLVSSTTTDPLTTVSSIRSVYAYFSLNEKQLLAFIRSRPGQTLQDKLARTPAVSLLLADGSRYASAGRVKTAIGQVSTATGSLNFRATFPNPQGLLRSGSSGTVRVPQPLDSALVVPQDATYELQGKRFVYTVGASNIVKSTEITTTPTPDGQFFVVQQGLKPGDHVVLDGVSTLKEGMAIQPKTVLATTVYTASLH